MLRYYVRAGCVKTVLTTWHLRFLASWYNSYKMTNKMQLCGTIYCTLTALHVSRDIFAHHQEHLNCTYSFWFCSRMSLSAAVMAEPWQQLSYCNRVHHKSHMYSPGIELESVTDRPSYGTTWWTGLCNGGTVCFLWSRIWGFKCYLGKFHALKFYGYMLLA